MHQAVKSTRRIAFAVLGALSLGSLGSLGTLAPPLPARSSSKEQQLPAQGDVGTSSDQRQQRRGARRTALRRRSRCAWFSSAPWRRR